MADVFQLLSYLLGFVNQMLVFIQIIHGRVAGDAAVVLGLILVRYNY